MADDWGDLEEQVEQAICAVMLNDDWKHAPTLTVTLRNTLEMRALPGIASQAARLVELLNEPLADMSATQRGDVSNALLDLLRLVHRRGLAND